MSAALFFDLDGTLAESEQQHWQAWRATFLPLGLDLTWAQYQTEAVGLPDPILVTRLARQVPQRLRHSDLQRVLHDKRRRFLRLIEQNSPLDPDTQDVLRSLAHVDMALVTSSTRAETSAIMHAAGLRRCFKAVVCLDDVERPKPDPEPYLLAMHHMGVSHGVAFEDSAAGKASARAAGLDVIEISRPTEFCSIMRSQFLALGRRRSGSHCAPRLCRR